MTAESERSAITLGRTLRVVRVVLLASAVAVIGALLITNWSTVWPYLRAIPPGVLVLAFIGALGSPILGVLGWRAILADLGSRLPLAPACGVFFIGQLGKYLPGSVWTVVMQTELASRVGVPRKRTGVAGLLAMVLALITGVVVGLPAAPLIVGTHERVLLFSGLAVVAMALVVSPPVLNPLVAWGMRRLGREPLEHPLSLRAVGTMCGWFVLSWASAGFLCWVLARQLANPGVSQGSLAVAAFMGFALASSLGMLSVILPAGVGVREAVLLVLLTPFMPLAAASAVVILARFLSIVADLVWAGVGWLWARNHHLWPGQDER